jgi:uncharacterized membrane protein
LKGRSRRIALAGVFCTVGGAATPVGDVAPALACIVLNAGHWCGLWPWRARRSEMQVSSILLIALLFCPLLAAAQVEAAQPAASQVQASAAASAASAAAQTTNVAATGASTRRLKFKGRGQSCHCAEPLGEEEIEAAARALAESDRRPTPKRSP